MARHVKWDESNLGEIEANKPVRQKITEPKTAYHPMIDNGEPLSPVQHGFNDMIDDFMDAEELCLGLNDVASANTKTKEQYGGWTSSEDEAEGMEQEDEVTLSCFGVDQTGASFMEQRRAHYDEFRKVKEVQQKGSFPDDEDDEDNGNEKRGDRPHR